MLVQFFVRDLLLAVWAQGQLLPLPLRLRTRHVVRFDAHGLAGAAFCGELGGLRAFALGGAFGDGGFFVGLYGGRLLWGGRVGVGLLLGRGHGVGLLWLLLLVVE